MDTNQNNVAVSALYTAGTWQWAGLANADIVTPKDSKGVFRVVNAYLIFYKWLNPRIFSLRHQLLHRHAAIDYLLKKSGCTRTVEVACGFSPRGASFSADPLHEYIEIDLPDMVRAKRAQLEKSAEGQAMLARKNFNIQSGDILQLNFAEQFNGQPTAVITEGLMMYFPRAQQLAIWRSIAALVAETGGVYLFDYIPLSEEPPRSGLGRLFHYLRFNILGIKGDFTYDDRDRHAVADDLRACGFGDIESFVTGEIAKTWQLPQADIPSHTIIYRCRTGLSATEAKDVI